MMNYFWKKKTMVSYLLSIFVLLIHVSTVYHYSFCEQKTALDIYQSFDVIMRWTFSLFAVPLFFILSGAVFFRDYAPQKYTSKLKNRISLLLMPFLIWNILNTVFEIVVTRTFLSRYLLGRTPFVFTAGNVFLSIFWFKTNSVFWFMFDLIVFSLAAPLIWILVRNRVSAVITVVALITLNIAGLGIPSSVFFRSDAIIYFFIGAIVGVHGFSTFSAKSNREFALLSVAITAACIGIEVINKLKILPIHDEWNVLILSVGAFSLWFSVDLLIDRLPMRPRYSNSFMIYAMNQNVEAIIVKVLFLIMPKNQWYAFPNFVLSVILTIVSINVASQLLRRYFPGIHRMLTGARA